MSRLRELAESLNLNPVPSSGGRHVCLCPFHADTVPSLVLYPDDTWHCFGCQAGGSISDLHKRLTGKPLPLALGSPIAPAPDDSEMKAASLYIAFAAAVRAGVDPTEVDRAVMAGQFRAAWGLMIQALSKR